MEEFEYEVELEWVTDATRQELAESGFTGVQVERVETPDYVSDETRRDMWFYLRIRTDQATFGKIVGDMPDVWDLQGCGLTMGDLTRTRAYRGLRGRPRERVKSSLPQIKKRERGSYRFHMESAPKDTPIDSWGYCEDDWLAQLRILRQAFGE